MDRELINARITEIGTCEDDVQRRELLTAFQEDLNKDSDELSTLRANNERLNNENEGLRSANMKLFLRIGDHKSPEEIAKEKGLDDPEKKMEFKDLFDEKGNLK